MVNFYSIKGGKKMKTEIEIEEMQRAIFNRVVKVNLDSLYNSITSRAEIHSILKLNTLHPEDQIRRQAVHFLTVELQNEVTEKLKFFKP